MKTKILLPTVLLVAFSVQHGGSQPLNVEYGLNYVFTAPTAGMRNYIQQGNGFTMDFGMTAPNGRLAAGIEMNYAVYGHTTTTQEYQFPDGTIADAQVTVNNSFLNTMAITRLYLKTEGYIRPYVSAKAGYSSWSTKLNIYDPNDADSCEPLETSLLKHDGTFIYSAGGGLRLDLAAIFKKRTPGRVFLDLSSSITQGGRVDYMNTDAPPPAHLHSTSTRSRDLKVEFINTQTQVIHQHHVGYVYSSFVQLVDFRLGLAWTLDLKHASCFRTVTE